MLGVPESVSDLAICLKILGEYFPRGYDGLSDLRGMIGLVAPGVDVGWSKPESFDCVESTNSVLEFSATREADLVLWVGPS